MPTAIVSGRVEVAVRDRANAYIKAAKMTPADVIKRVWENIAKTGEMPVIQQKASYDDPDDSFERFMAFRATCPTPAADWISTMSDDQMKDLIAEHLVERYA